MRQTEARARGPAATAGDRPRRQARRAPHPDQVEAAERLGEALGRALGADVASRRGRGRLPRPLAFESLDEALAAAERSGRREAA